MTTNGGSRMGSIWPAIVVIVAIVALGIGIEVFFVGTELGQRLDASTFGAVVPLRESLGPMADRVRLIVPVIAAALALIALIVAVVRRRWRAIASASALVVLSWVVSTVLKEVVVQRPNLGDYGYEHNSFPSGHAAVSVAALIAIQWLVRRPIPALIVPLALIGAAASLAQVVSYAHRLSDILGGALVAGAIAAFGLERGGSLRARSRVMLWCGVVLVAAAGVLCLVDWQASDYAGDQWIATAGIGLCAAACAGASLIIGAEASRPRGAGVVDRVSAAREPA